MSKELEALNKIKHASLTVEKHDATSGSITIIPIVNTEEYETIKSYLTPPTADEVCEELDKWYIGVTGDILIASINDFTYDKDEKRFYKRMLNQPHQMTICKIDTNNCIQFREPLPSKTTTLIGRFYEGIEELK